MNNSFCVFPSSFYKLINLKEFSLEWFTYLQPPIDALVKL